MATKKDYEVVAQVAQIKGRSKMNKAQLEEALSEIAQEASMSNAEAEQAMKDLGIL